MKTFIPDELDFTSEDGKVILTIHKDRHAELKKKKNFFFSDNFRWKDKISYPSKTIISTIYNKVYLLGGIGDPSSELGVILIYNFDGSLVNKLNVNEVVPNLEDLSRNYGGKGNFPWIHSVTLNKEKNSLSINICGQLTVEIGEDGKLVR
jgi:hypothetical protein